MLLARNIACIYKKLTVRMYKKFTFDLQMVHGTLPN